MDDEVCIDLLRQAAEVDKRAASQRDELLLGVGTGVSPTNGSAPTHVEGDEDAVDDAATVLERRLERYARKRKLQKDIDELRSQESPLSADDFAEQMRKMQRVLSRLGYVSDDKLVQLKGCAGYSTTHKATLGAYVSDSTDACRLHLDNAQAALVMLPTTGVPRPRLNRPMSFSSRNSS